jgi:hypothetical protein
MNGPSPGSGLVLWGSEEDIDRKGYQDHNDLDNFSDQAGFHL